MPDPHIGRRYRCTVPHYPACRWGVGICVEYTTDGCPQGWYTLEFPSGERGLLTGNEVSAVEPRP